jgi:hypothetical protein
MLFKIIIYTCLTIGFIAICLLSWFLVKQNVLLGKPEFKDPNCLTRETFDTIFEDDRASDFSKYSITKTSDSSLKFSNSNGYTLFILEKTGEDPGVKLKGLDGYGMRDKKFRYFICELAHKLISSRPK